MNPKTMNNNQDYDIITVIIVLVSCIITTLINELTALTQCLTSNHLKISTPTPGKSGGRSKTTTRTTTSKTKNQQRSQSTKLTSDTVDQKKVAGGTRKACPKKRTASSTRNKQSKDLLNSQTSIKLSNNQVLEIQQPIPTGNSVSPMTMQ